MEFFHFTPGKAPLLVSMPHVGIFVPPEMAARMTEVGRALPDTDWYVDRLYDFLGELGASVLTATHSRSVIDLNRAPDGRPLYPGADETELCPTTTFAEQAIYLPGEAPDRIEIDDRRTTFWQPYHDCLRQELNALKERHGWALLWEAHSIRSRVPRFFEGRLPDLNIGTGGGVTADPALTACLVEVAEGAGQAGYSHAVNGRFKGGYSTLHYGDPAHGIHAIQLELAQVTYMDEAPPYGFRDDLAATIRPVLRDLLAAALGWLQG